MRAGFKAGLAAMTVALGVFVNEMRRQFSEIDQLAKDAFRFGVAIEDIRGLELAANLAGLSLSEMSTILRDTTRRVSEAAQGTGEAQDAIKELGLDAKELNLLPVSEQLDVILGRLQNVENQNDKVRLAYDIMGRSGTKALTIQAGAIRQAIRETELLGTALDEDIARNVQNANDEMTRLKQAFKGIVQFAVAEAAPSITKFLKNVKQFLIEIRNGIKAIPLTLEAEFLKIRQLFAGLEKDILGSKIGRALFGDQPALDLGELIKADQQQLDAINRQLQDLTRLGGNLGGGDGPAFQPPGADIADASASAARSTSPAGMPGISSGRLITGSAQSSAERLAMIAKEADDKRRREAEQARQQRKEANELLRELIRGAVQNSNANLGTLLQ